MALRGRPWRTLFAGGRRTPWINGGLAVLLVVAVVLAFTVIGNPSTPAALVRTAVVTRGDVTATVTGSGNAASQASVPVSFATDGTVTAVDVKAGDTVTAGQVLATVDPAASNEGLRTARAPARPTSRDSRTSRRSPRRSRPSTTRAPSWRTTRRRRRRTSRPRGCS